ncbi:MAG TPA: dipeptidase [Candidatus Sulfotelmatobacter sp.]|nr:dipeptidase [Candidatus Sulfotelmatobacter sp.]
MDPHRALKYSRSRRANFVTELKEFVWFPSVSNQPKHAADLRRCAAWLANHLRRIGMENVRVVPTRRHPIVYASWLHAQRRPTILIYGHYDVQPAEPFSEWRTPPFEPVVRDNNLYGRGACDDKGQLFTHVKALESYLKTERSLPVNVKCIFEGEEEVGGSVGLEKFVLRNRNALGADAAVMSDTRMLGPGRPAIGYSQRGNLRFELEVRGPKEDLHSGNFGGVIHNPLQALCEIVAGMHYSEGRVAIPGFYDNVREWSAKEREYMARTGPKDDEILHDAHVPQAWGEPGFSLYERITIRPALTLNGIRGGYGGAGIKTVIPSRALAKISIRIVPDQKPREIDKLLREYIRRAAPPTVEANLRALAVSHPALVNRNHPALRAAAVAYRRGFGAAPVFLRSGGSVPAASIFQKTLGIPTVLMGFALPDDHVHAPNEKFHLPNFFRGIETSIWYLAAAAKLRDSQRQPEPEEEWSA